MSSTDAEKSTPGGRVKSAQSLGSNEPDLDATSERKLLWKIDIHLLPVLGILYLCAFLDRINIGNARIQGMEKDLNMTGHDYNIALFIFFIFYITLEVPCNIILKNIKPYIWLPSIMLGWGVITICQGVTASFAGLVVCRLFLGIFEAGFVPGAVYLISMYYKRLELQWRINIFFACSIMAGAFSGLLAYAIAYMDGIGGYAGWRWIFLIEGLFTVLVAVWAFWALPGWPEDAQFLTPAERDYNIRRLADDAGPSASNRWNKQTAKLVFGDVKIWLATVGYIGIVNTGYSTSYFTPTIISEFGSGYVGVRAQVMSIPIYIVATCFTLIAALLSDKLKHRYGFTMLGLLIATVGYAIMLNMGAVAVGVRYFALFAIVTGGYITQPILMGWLNNNLGGHYKRGVGAAMQVGIGNCGGLIASNIFLTSQEPTFPLGFGLSLGLLWLCGICNTLLLFVLIRENRIRKEGGRDERLQGLTPAEENNLGDDHPGFRFVY